MTQPAKQEVNSGALAAIQPSRLPYYTKMEEVFGIDKGAWKVLTDAIFPSAKSADSISMALQYCRSRKLDIMKKPVHIVPVWSSQLNRMVETVWPSITEHRITAMRTGEYAGKDATAFGPNVTKRIGKIEITFPEWAEVTLYRLIHGQKCAFVGDKVYWEEAYAQTGGKEKDITPNTMWAKRPHGQLAKCAEAAALRCAFPEEVGSMSTAEEMEGQVIDQVQTDTPSGDSIGRSSTGAVEDQLAKETNPDTNAAQANEPDPDGEASQSESGPGLHDGDGGEPEQQAAQEGFSPEPEITDAEYEEVITHEQPNKTVVNEPDWTEVDEWDGETLNVGGRGVVQEWPNAVAAAKYLAGCMRKRKKKDSRRKLFDENLPLIKTLRRTGSTILNELDTLLDEGEVEEADAGTDGN